MGDDNLIQLRPGVGQTEFSVAASNCTHYSGCVVDESTRKVTCGQCGALLEPFDRLLKIAKDAERKQKTTADYRAEVSAMDKRVKMLKRLETNARARLQRLGVEVHNALKWRSSFPNAQTIPPHVVAVVRGIPYGHLVVEAEPEIELVLEPSQARDLGRRLCEGADELFRAAREAKGASA